MSIFYSASKGGFFDTAIHRSLFINAKREGLKPDPKGEIADAVPVTDEEHCALLEGQSQGKIIQADETGAPVLVFPPDPTQAELKASLSAAVQLHLDEAAKAAGYDDIKSAVTYADEPVVPQFQEEGRAFRQWRSLVWAHVAEVLAAVDAGERPMPTAADLLARLPARALA